MAAYRLSKDADADLADIMRHSLGKWGVDQTTDYMTKLESGFSSLSDAVLASRKFSDNFSEVYFARCAHHYVFYLLPEK